MVNSLLCPTDIGPIIGFFRIPEDTSISILVPLAHEEQFDPNPNPEVPFKSLGFKGHLCPRDLGPFADLVD